MTAMDSTFRRLRPPSPDTWGKGFPLAIMVHIALLVALAFGVHWRSSEPAGIEAELLAAVPQQAAPKAVEPPKPVPKVEPKVEPKPEPPPPPPPKVEAPPQPTEAEIALEKARQEQARREKEALEAEQKRRQLEEQKRQQAEAERKRREAEEERRLAAEREAQRKREEERKLAQQRAAEEARLEALRKENLERMTAQAGGSGGEGTAARSAGPSAGYAGRIVARVKPNIVFGDELAGNPAAEVEVRAAPDGTIVGRRLVRSSGAREWDEAVLRAVDRTGALPRDVDGRVPPTIVITFRPRD